MVLPILGLFWFTMGFFCFKKTKIIIRNFTLSTVVLLYILHPALVSIGLGLFNCYELDDGEFWLVKDMQVRCWDARHYKWALSIGLPMLLIWGIGLPCAGFFVLRANRA